MYPQLSCSALSASAVTIGFKLCAWNNVRSRVRAAVASASMSSCEKEPYHMVASSLEPVSPQFTIEFMRTLLVATRGGPLPGSYPFETRPTLCSPRATIAAIPPSCPPSRSATDAAIACVPALRSAAQLTLGGAFVGGVAGRWMVRFNFCRPIALGGARFALWLH
ncbi:hypothetical protein BC830DRAFT_168558 [Chytriomyces sp. MP71]|nr:hypothetical protein BC830DRAFT_168558 [Chytriomyces sp. MP71]